MRTFAVVILSAILVSYAVGLTMASDPAALTKTLLWKAPERCHPDVIRLGVQEGKLILAPIIVCDPEA